MNNNDAVMREELAWRRQEDVLEVQAEMARGCKEIEIEDLGSSGYLFLKRCHPSAEQQRPPARPAKTWPRPEQPPHQPPQSMHLTH